MSDFDPRLGNVMRQSAPGVAGTTASVALSAPASAGDAAQHAVSVFGLTAPEWSIVVSILTAVFVGVQLAVFLWKTWQGRAKG